MSHSPSLSRSLRNRLLFEVQSEGHPPIEFLAADGDLVVFAWTAPDFPATKRGRGERQIVWAVERPLLVPEQVAEVAEGLRQKHPSGRTVLLFLGGISPSGQVLEKLTRSLKRPDQTPVVHLSDLGELTRSSAVPLPPGVEALARALAQGDQPPSGAWAEFSKKLEADDAQRRLQAEEMQAFAGRLQRRQPRLTWFLAALIVGMFGLELLWNGLELPPVLIRMGALVSLAELDGEWWRLLSITFLHGSVLHLLFNLWVLVALGSSLERMLGPWRFLVLYVLSGVGGSLASASSLGSSFSVGASGALWGLLAAEGVLGYRPRGLLPQAIAAQARKVAGINLLLNVANSLRPNVDLWGHFGGGAVGAILLFSGLLTWGLPRLDSLRKSAEPSKASEEFLPGWIHVGGLLGGAALLASPVLALLNGRPWAIQRPELAEPQEVAFLDARVSLPPLRGSQTVSEDGPARTALWGHLRRDPCVVLVTKVEGLGWDVSPSPDAPSGSPGEETPAPGSTGEVPAQAKVSQDSVAIAQARSVLLGLGREGLSKAEEGYRLVGEVEDVTVGGTPGLRAISRKDTGLRIERVLRYDSSVLWRVEAICWPEFEAAYGRLGLQVADAIQPLSQPPSPASAP